MSQLTIIYYSTGDCKENLRFRESCQNHGLRLKVYSDLFGAKDAIDSCESEYVICAVANQVIALRSERDIVALIGSSNRPIIAGDRVPEIEVDERIDSSTDMQFLNRVLIGGTKAAMVSHLKDPSLPTIDMYCNLFQPIHGEKLGVSLIVDPNLHLLQNTDTGAYPCFVWFNQSGKELDEAMQEFEEWSR